MDSSPVIVEISSDEEGNDGKGAQDSDSLLDWLDNFLDDDDLPSNDVVVIDEFPSGSPSGRRRPFSDDELACYSLNPKRSCPPKPAGSPDEDCVVLDGDPDKPDPVLEKSGDGSDDLAVISEKANTAEVSVSSGEVLDTGVHHPDRSIGVTVCSHAQEVVACRDFPHSRHLCVKFPFAATSHEKFCDLCHCYVYDILAPCAYWGTGGSPGDHCHSSDREEKWKVARRSFKLGHFQNAVPLTTTKATISRSPSVLNPVVVSLTQCRTISPLPLQQLPFRSNSQVIPSADGCVGSMPNIIRRKRDARTPFSPGRNAFPHVRNNKHWLMQRVPKPRRIPDYYPSQFSSAVTATTASTPRTFQIVNRPSVRGAVTSMPQKRRHPSLMPSDESHLSRVEEFLLGSDSGLDTSQNLCIARDGKQKRFTSSREILNNSSLAPDPTYECTLPASTTSCGNSAQNIVTSETVRTVIPSYPPGSTYEYPLRDSTTSCGNSTQNLVTSESVHATYPCYPSGSTYECSLQASTRSCSNSAQNLVASESVHATISSYPPGSNYEHPLPASPSTFGSICNSQFSSYIYPSSKQSALDVIDPQRPGDGPASITTLTVHPVLPNRDTVVPLEAFNPSGPNSPTGATLGPELETWLFQSETANGDSGIPELHIVLPDSTIDSTAIRLDTGSPWENRIA